MHDVIRLNTRFRNCPRRNIFFFRRFGNPCIDITRYICVGESANFSVDYIIRIPPPRGRSNLSVRMKSITLKRRCPFVKAPGRFLWSKWTDSINLRIWQTLSNLNKNFAYYVRFILQILLTFQFYYRYTHSSNTSKSFRENLSYLYILIFHVDRVIYLYGVANLTVVGRQMLMQ